MLFTARCRECGEEIMVSSVNGRSFCLTCYKAQEQERKSPWLLIWIVIVLLIVGLVLCSIERRADGEEVMLSQGSTSEAPWLGDGEHRRVLAKMPKGVPVPANLRFYKLPQKWQSLYTMNGGQPHRDILPVTNEEDPWRFSGGMTNVDRRDWYNVTGLSLPTGQRILVWEEWQDVGAFGPVPKIRWRFPDGTLAYDILFNRPDGSEVSERIFEVRIHRKRGDGWDGGTRYAPEVEEEQEGTTWQWSFPSVGIECRQTVRPAIFAARPAFTQTKSVHEGFAPQGYLGAGTACNVCHDRVGERTGYAAGRRGDDGRFSWHPWNERNEIDARWPLDRR